MSQPRPWIKPPELRITFPAHADSGAPVDNISTIHLAEAAALACGNHPTYIVLRNAWDVTPRALHEAEQHARLRGRRLSDIRLLWGDDRDDW